VRALAYVGEHLRLERGHDYGRTFSHRSDDSAGHETGKHPALAAEARA
jgi:hypothetical protein